jgi:FixJ family two-component response regulator
MTNRSAAGHESIAPTIFIVDDDDSLRRALARLLSAQGWNTETFGSARQFLEREPFDGTGCVLLDVSMPGLTGPEAHAELLAREFTLPVIFLTAHGELETGIAAMKRGAVDFLAKPVDEEALLAVLRQAMARHGRQRIEHLHRRAIGNRLARLSPREREVLALVTSGLLNKQIADRLGISIKTVKVHRAHVMEKMEADSVAALVRQCETAGPGPAAPPR